MLLIWDIHANARHINAILDNMKSFVAKFSDEKNIIFLWDYMYMFSYDRQALGELFDFFLELREGWKNVYILTGNHDWLNQHFVYHEGKKALDMLSKQYSIRHSEQREESREWQNDKMTKWLNKIHFIVEPEIHTIEDKEILFMPYNKGFLGNYMNSISHPELVEGSQNQLSFDAIAKNTSLPWDSSLHSEWREIITSETTHLLDSPNYNEQLSGALNHYLLQNYKPGMTLIHHYYTANISFPGQQAKFDYKDISLHPGWTKYADNIISGHLHKAFIHENYLCAGSIRSTTSGERNQSKFLWKRDTKSDTYEAYEIAINPYISVEWWENLTVNTLQNHIATVQKEHISLLPNIQVHQTSYNLEKVSLILYSNDTVQDIENIIDPWLKASLGDIQLKQVSSNHKDMTELLDITQYNIKESLLDWKELVKKYLMSRYWPESEKYRTLLSELNIL